jgi:uncharacterized protein YbgA (DUF1722 family)
MSQPVKIILDDRLRLLSAALSATNFPQRAQERKRHHAHAYARATLKYLTDSGQHQHEAVQTLQAMLDKGITLEALFGVVYRASTPNLTLEDAPEWLPTGWLAQLWAFQQAADLPTFWSNTQYARAWEDAEMQAKEIFADQVKFREFLTIFFGEMPQTFVFMPNLGYPADVEVGFATADELVCVVPPPLAWGESPPWPYNEATNVGHSYRSALSQYTRLLLQSYLRQNADKVAQASQKELPITEQLKAQYPTWEEQFVALFISGAVAIYLEDYYSKAEAQAFAMMEKRARGMVILPATISVLRRYMQEHGGKFHALADFLNVFPAQLRVAKRIVTM